MRTLLKIIAVLSLALAGIAGINNTTQAQNNPEGSAYANVLLCTDADCSEATGGMEGAVVTSFDAAGVEIDSCAVETFPSGMDGCVLAQHEGDGWYEVSNLHDGYALLSDAPEVLESESHGTQLNWFAAPITENGEIPAEEDPVTSLPETGSGVVEQRGLLAAAALGIALMAVGATGARKFVRC